MATPPERSVNSPQNRQLKEIRRALERGEPTADGLCAIEGHHLLAEALNSPVEVVRVFHSGSVAGLPRAIEQTGVPDPVLTQIASTETSPGVIALIRFPAFSDSADASRGPGRAPLSVYLDGIQDPGNAGTIIRSAEAFGVTEVIFGIGTVSPFNPKALRAAAGSLFRTRFERGEFPAGRALDRVWYWASPREGVEAAAVDWTGPAGLIVGSEAHGVDPARQQVARPVRIPTSGVESLNAAVAASILLYEAARQRRAGPGPK
jgi:TrmH family RNA methyltransferase